MKRTLALLVLICIGVIASGQTRWKATSGVVSFSIRNMASTVDGSLGGLTTSIVFSPDKLAASSLRGTVSVATINTGNSKRDKDLQEEKYFNAARYRLIDVRS